MCIRDRLLTVIDAPAELLTPRALGDFQLHLVPPATDDPELWHRDMDLAMQVAAGLPRNGWIHPVLAVSWISDGGLVAAYPVLQQFMTQYPDVRRVLVTPQVFSSSEKAMLTESGYRVQDHI